MNTADYFTVRTFDKNDRKVLRHTNFRAVIDLAEARQPGHRGQLTIRVEAHDAEVDWDGYDVSYLYETDLPGAHVDGLPTDILGPALDILAAEGLELAGIGWEYTADRYTAGLRPIGATL